MVTSFSTRGIFDVVVRLFQVVCPTLQNAKRCPSASERPSWGWLVASKVGCLRTLCLSRQWHNIHRRWILWIVFGVLCLQKFDLPFNLVQVWCECCPPAFVEAHSLLRWKHPIILSPLIFTKVDQKLFFVHRDRQISVAYNRLFKQILLHSSLWIKQTNCYFIYYWLLN